MATTFRNLLVISDIAGPVEHIGLHFSHGPDIQLTLHNSDRFYPDFCIFWTELLSPISFLLKCNTEKVSA